MDKAIKSFVDRKIIREQLEREGHKGYREDVAELCICECGNSHYRPRKENDENRLSRSESETEGDRVLL